MGAGSTWLFATGKRLRDVSELDGQCRAAWHHQLKMIGVSGSIGVERGITAERGPDAEVAVKRHPSGQSVGVIDGRPLVRV